MEKPAVKNIPSSFKRFWALQVPSLQNKVNWDNWDNCYNYYNRYHYNWVIGVNGAIGPNGKIGVTGVNGLNSGFSLTLVPKPNNNNYMNLLLTGYECKPVKREHDPKFDFGEQINQLL